MKPAPGTYALILHSSLSADIQIGRWGYLRVEPGYYVYIGSAFGPGGVRARVSRHFRKAKRSYWHIDYLREMIDPVCAWCSYAPFRLEHQWAQTLGQMADISCIKGFGCSDCSCDGHLFAMSTAPDSAKVFTSIGGVVELWPYRTPTYYTP